MLPLILKPTNVPTVVMLGCDAVVKVPVSKLPLTVPELAYTLPAVILAVTAKLDSVPTLVNDELTIVPANVVPVKLAALAAITTLAAALS